MARGTDPFPWKKDQTSPSESTQKLGAKAVFSRVVKYRSDPARKGSGSQAFFDNHSPIMSVEQFNLTA